MRKAILHILVMVSAVGCSPKNELPQNKYYQFDYPVKYSCTNDTLEVAIGNPLKCPLRISISSSDKSLRAIVARFGTLTLRERSDTVIKYYFKCKKNILLSFNSVIGDVKQKIKIEKLGLPFPKKRSYNIIQGFNGSHSHNTDYARYTIDFSLKIKDTVCSAADGYVVGVVKEYELGGRSEDWMDYSNYITIYHPRDGLYTQYVHLVKNGSFVKVGDTVVKGQAIGLSGMTGYTTVPHLHFALLRPDEKKGLVSINDIEFEEGYKGKELTENSRVKK